MKVVFLIPVAIALLITGCSQSSGPGSSAASATNDAQAGKAASVNATPNYGGVLGQAQSFSENQIGLAQLKEAVQEFNATEGRYPKDLQELIPAYLAKMPVVPAGYTISYDPTNGQVQVVRQR